MMPDNVIIQTRSRSQDVGGGWTEDWVNSYVEVPARFGEISGSESQATDREHLQADYMVTVPWNQSVHETDRIVYQGETYEVVFVNAVRSNLTAKRCLVRKV